MRRAEAVVFDLWDTLVPFGDEEWRRTLNELADEFGVDPLAYSDAWSEDRLARDSGELEESVRRIYDKLGLALDDEVMEKILQRRRAAFQIAFVPRDGAVPTLERLRERGLKTGLITNCSSEIPAMWDESPLAPLVDACVFSCRERARKPEPRLYREAASRLGVDPEACVYVGDGADDELAGAAGVGMRPILLRTQSQRDWDGEAIDRLPEVVELVEQE
jgi:putative hydrolase of the HAD superfamily